MVALKLKTAKNGKDFQMGVMQVFWSYAMLQKIRFRVHSERSSTLSVTVTIHVEYKRDLASRQPFRVMTRENCFGETLCLDLLYVPSSFRSISSLLTIKAKK